MSIPIEALSEQFSPDQIKQRKGNFGNMISYADSATVTQCLNEVLEGEWSFAVLEHIIDTDEVIVKGRLQIGNAIHEQYGGSSITRKSDTQAVISIADDLKAASADCLKKWASSFGVGLYLYGGSQQQQSGNGHVTNETIAKIFSSSKRAGVPQSQVIKTAMETYGKPISQLNTQQAEELMEQFTVKQTEGG